jgi:hypothetical protein
MRRRIVWCLLAVVAAVLGYQRECHGRARPSPAHR